MVRTWGEKRWGLGEWGGGDPIGVYPDNSRGLLDNWPYRQIYPDPEEAIFDILLAIEQQLDGIDVQADELYEQRFIDTATTHELAKLGEEVGVVREENESEQHYRVRATLSKAISSSDGTIYDLAQILQIAFGDEVTNVSIRPATDAPAIEVVVPSDALGDIPLTDTELEHLLEDAVPASDGVTVLTSDTWLLGESGSQGLGEGGLS